MSLAVWIFASAAAFLLYTLAGYPLLLAWLARRNPKPVRRDSTPRTVTVLICVYNGERWIRKKLTSIAAMDYPPELVDVLVVSDGSTDGTDQAVAEFPGYGCCASPTAESPRRSTRGSRRLRASSSPMYASRSTGIACAA
jgi:hypothetical protein